MCIRDRSTVATVTGLIAKENVVSTFGVLFGLGADLAEDVYKRQAETCNFQFLPAYADGTFSDPNAVLTLSLIHI